MKLILLVEPDPGNARSIKSAFTWENPYRVHHAETAESAFEKTSDHRYDLLIVERTLPEMGGRWFTEKLRAQDYPSPCLMITGRENDRDVARCLNTGAHDCLRRSFDERELRARVRALLRRPPDWSSRDETEVGPLVIDTAQREARFNGEPIPLRRKEFDILRLLAQKYPDIARRTELAEEVWDEGVSANSIDVTISGLRKKIEAAQEDANERLRIETIRGVGYRLGGIEQACDPNVFIARRETAVPSGLAPSVGPVIRHSHPEQYPIRTNPRLGLRHRFCSTLQRSCRYSLKRLFSRHVLSPAARCTMPSRLLIRRHKSLM